MSFPDFRGERVETRVASASAFNFASSLYDHYPLIRLREAQGASFLSEAFGNHQDGQRVPSLQQVGIFNLQTSSGFSDPQFLSQIFLGPRSPDQ